MPEVVPNSLSPEQSPASQEDWGAQRREIAAQKARLLQANQHAENVRAARIVNLFLQVARAEGLAPQPLRVRGYRGGSARTKLQGWYLRSDKTVGIDTSGNFYVLSRALSWKEKLFGATIAPEPVPLTIGAGGRDGDVIPLQFALNKLLPGWEERSPEPLA